MRIIRGLLRLTLFFIKNKELNLKTEPILVSIIMPTYNRAHMVGEAIDSVLAQTYQNWELILVNDGSKDGTREVLDSYVAKERRIRAIHKENEGIPFTVNRGFAETKGEYVTWGCDDNNFHPQAIEKMAEYLTAHSDVGLVYSDVNDVDADGKFLRRVDTGEPEAMKTYCGIRCCLMLRRNVWAEAGAWEKRWVRCHDYDFYLKVMKKYPITHLKEVLLDYRCHDASMSGDHVKHVHEETELLCHHNPGFMKCRAIRAKGQKELARTYHRDGNGRKAFLAHCKAAWYTPTYFPAAVGYGINLVRNSFWGRVK